jgi:hypothetical protein
MYNAGLFLIDNPANRYAIGSSDQLRYNADGSLDIYVQRQSPGADRESNWLPAPADSFILSLRLGWPDAPALDGTWQPPAVQPVR